MIRIVTDGSVDMPDGWKEKYKINVLPLNIRFGEEEYLSSYFQSSSDFYAMVQEKRIPPRTSLPSPLQVIEFYRKIAQRGETILSIHIASKMSGTYGIVQSAARELMDEFRIFVFDSGCGSAALGYMCREIRLLAEDNFPPEKIIDQLENIKKKLTLIFTLNTLEFAYISGRINRFQNTVSSLLNIKPIIVLKDGLLQMAQKVRTRQNALDKMIEMIQERAHDSLVDIAVVHADDLKSAQDLVNKIGDRLKLNIREIMITELSFPVAANLGPGTVGVVAFPVINEGL